MSTNISHCHHLITCIKSYSLYSGDRFLHGRLMQIATKWPTATRWISICCTIIKYAHFLTRASAQDQAPNSPAWLHAGAHRGRTAARNIPQSRASDEHFPITFIFHSLHSATYPWTRLSEAEVYPSRLEAEGGETQVHTLAHSFIPTGNLGVSN